MIRKCIKLVSIWVVGSLSLFFVAEGLSSLFLIIGKELKERGAEIYFVEFDKEIGWVNKPNIHFKDFWAPGKHLTITSNRSRFTPDSKTNDYLSSKKILCAGDSFTFGVGVGDKDTWVNKLASWSRGASFDNFGIGGYGLDQAFSLLKRTSEKKDYDVHLVSLITPDLERIVLFNDRKNESVRPNWAVENGKLVMKNYPLKRKSRFRIAEITDTLRNTATYHLVKQMVKPLKHNKSAENLKKENLMREEIAIKILEGLRDFSRQTHSKLVVIYLPFKEDYGSKYSSRWEEIFASFCENNSILFIDLLPYFQSLSAANMGSLFINPDEVDFHKAAGHYNEAGNDLIGRLIYAELLKKGVL